MAAVFEELRYNLKKGIFINIILAVQFAVFFWQGTMLSTYFLDMRSSGWGAGSVPGNYSYYSIGGFRNIFTASLQIRTMRQIWQRHLAKSMKIRICTIWRLGAE